MKFTVNVDCTPEEARSFLGLPDVSPINDKYVQTIMDRMTSGSASLEQMEGLIKAVSPMGDAGMKMFKQMMDIGLGAAGKGKSGA